MLRQRQPFGNGLRKFGCGKFCSFGRFSSDLQNAVDSHSLLAAVNVYAGALSMPFRGLHLLLAAGLSFLLGVGFPASAQTSGPVRFLEKSKIFILDAGKVSYVFGINEQSMLQHIYWGGHVRRDSDFSSAHSFPEWASFDLGTTTTPQEYPGWGAGLYVEPSL